MHPHIPVSITPVLLAALAQFFIGFIWYTVLFGKLWAKELKISMDQKPSTSFMIRSMTLNMIGNLLTAYVLFHTVNIWRSSVWNAGEDSPFYLYGFFGALFTWIGFFIPQNLVGSAWEGKSWVVFGIDSSGQFLSLLAASMIVAAMF